MQFLYRQADDRIERVANFLGHFEADGEGFRLNADETDFRGRCARQFRGKKKIGEADVMDRELCIENGRNVVAFDDPDMPRGLFEIDGVNNEDSILRLEKGKQVEPHRAAVDDIDVRGKDVSALDGMDGMNAETFIA